MARKKHIVLGVTGSIAAYKAGDIIRHLLDKEFEVTVVMSHEAEHFITPLTLSTLSGRKVYRSSFEDEGAWKMPHISLAQEADIFLIAPATANVIGKMAHGIADDLITCIALGTRAKIILAPAMNDQMYKNLIVQQNCRILEKAGAVIIDPVKGKLACGVTGQGHIADEETIVREVIKALKNKA